MRRSVVEMLLVIVGWLRSVVEMLQGMVGWLLDWNCFFFNNILLS